MEIKTKLANSSNFTKGRNTSIKYIVIHFTANNGDTAKGNCNYFQGTNRNASAHYFVDENEIYQSVLDTDTAWHCGANKYYHSYCRNSNSIGVELCSRIDSKGKYYFKDETVTNAIELVKMLMKKYNVPIENILRHYDVTGKICPEPFVRNVKDWNNFKTRLVVTEESKEIDDEMVTEMNIQINGKDIKINRILKENKNYIEVAGLENAGFDVGYQKETKLVTVNNQPKEIKISVDGENKQVLSINVGGTNYVSIRKLCEILGINVDYKNGVVVIQK